MPSLLSKLLELEQVDNNRFSCNQHLSNRFDALFGGQVLAQSVCAASYTVTERLIHSAHGYFLRAGSRHAPLQFTVERVRDGGSFSTRSVTVQQEGKVIFQMLASFHCRENGISHQQAFPPTVANGDIQQLPQPEALATVEEQARCYPEILPYFLSASAAIDLRPVSIDGYLNDKVSSEQGRFWFRACGELSSEQAVQRAALAFASDRCLASTSAFPHPICMFDKNLRSASLDHAMWFHADVDVTQWHLYITDSPWAGEGRGLNRGAIYTRDGNLVATTTQEGLIRGVENVLS